MNRNDRMLVGDNDGKEIGRIKCKTMMQHIWKECEPCVTRSGAKKLEKWMLEGDIYNLDGAFTPRIVGYHII